MTNTTSFAATSGKDRTSRVGAVRGGTKGAEAKGASRTMDMTRYAGDLYLKVEDIRESGPKQVKIEGVEDGQFDKPVAAFNDGTSLSLNHTNVRTLMRSYGPESNDWIGRNIELYIGPTTYQGRVQDSILVKPISPPILLSERKPLKPPKPNPEPLDDNIPF
jgi:hypothetical protein